MEDFLRANVARALRMVEAADVLVVGFTLFPERLLADLRFTDQDPPLIAVVPPVSSVEERIKELQQARPQLPAPARLHFFIWPRRIGTFERVSVWRHIAQRCLDSGHARIAGDCNLALERLYQLEQAELWEALRGPKYHTVWEHPR